VGEPDRLGGLSQFAALADTGIAEVVCVEVLVAHAANQLSPLLTCTNQGVLRIIIQIIDDEDVIQPAGHILSPAR
jgi:hypothetical protein